MLPTMLPARPFYMIRHGETVMNAKKLCCGGGVDTPLTDDGRAQAAMVARVLEVLDEGPTLIVNSNMSRTRETTDIVNKNARLPVVEDHDLREHMLGAWEQKPWDEIIPKLFTDEKPDGGESTPEYDLRVRGALSGHLSRHPGERLLFVVHGGTFHAILRQYRYPGASGIFIPNATLHHFDPEPGHEHDPMPWRVRQMTWETDRAVTAPAVFCPSQLKNKGV